MMQFKKTIRITPHPQPLSHASGERGEKTLLLAPLPEFGEGPGVGSVLRLHKLNCIIASAVPKPISCNRTKLPACLVATVFGVDKRAT